jgi:SAM-dependent methyltransferase
MWTRSYDGLPIHRVMLEDHVRTDLYRRAIEATVRPGDVVLDLGAGTGILSLFAARSGARKIYAVERTAMARIARLLVARNGAASRVEVIEAPIEYVTLPRRVDVIVSEWLGAYGVDENLLPLVLLARDRWLKRGGRLLPHRVTAWIAPIRDGDIEAEQEFWHGRPYGVDLSVVARAVDEARWSQSPLPADRLVATPRLLWSHDLYTCATERAWLPSRASLTLDAARDARLNALTTWFSADFGGDLTLTNSPDAPPTHWGRYVFPLERSLAVTRGTPIAIEFVCIPAGPGYCHTAWSVRVGDGSWEHHDTRRAVAWG